MFTKLFRTLSARIIFSSVLILFTLGICNVAFAQDKPILLVLNKNESTLSFIDATEMKLLGSVKTGDSPHEVIAMSDGKTAIVANYGAQVPGNSLSVIDIVTQKELRKVELGALMRPHGLVEIAGKIYFTAEVNRLIGRYDPAANKVDWLMGTGQNASHMLVVTPDQKKIYTANVGSDSVTAFEFNSVPPAQSKIEQIAVGKQPEAIDISPDGKEVWVGLNVEGAIDVIDTAEKKVVKKIALGNRPYRVKFTPDGKSVVATVFQTSELVLIDPVTKAETKRLKLDSVPIGITFSRDSKFAFVSTVQADGALKIDMTKFEVVGKSEAGQGPDGIALAGM